MNQRAASSFGLLSFVAILGFMAFNFVDADITSTTTAPSTAAAPGSAPGVAGGRDNGPLVGDHWHNVFGVNICGTWMPDLMSTIDEFGIHSHQDGLIHIHPFDANAAEENATLDVFFDAMQIEVSNNGITWDDGRFFSATEACGEDQPSQMRLYRFTAPLIATSDHGVTFSDFGAERFMTDRQGFALVIGPEDMPIEMPPSRAMLDQVPPATDLATQSLVPPNEVRTIDDVVASAQQAAAEAALAAPRAPSERQWGFIAATFDQWTADFDNAIQEAQNRGVDILVYATDSGSETMKSSDGTSRTFEEDLIWRWTQTRSEDGVLIVTNLKGDNLVIAPDLAEGRVATLNASASQQDSLINEVIAAVLADS